MSPEAKTALISFAIGIFTHKAQNKIGDIVIDPLVSQLKQIPRIVHYLERDRGFSVGCHECLLRVEKHFDSITD